MPLWLPTTSMFSVLSVSTSMQPCQLTTPSDLLYTAVTGTGGGTLESSRAISVRICSTLTPDIRSNSRATNGLVDCRLVAAKGLPKVMTPRTEPGNSRASSRP